MIRVVLPFHLQNLAQAGKEISLPVEGKVTLGAVLEVLESNYPMLRGTIRDQVTFQRRPFLRYFACGQDLSFEALDTLLPAEVISGREPLRIVGAMAGG